MQEWFFQYSLGRPPDPETLRRLLTSIADDLVAGPELSLRRTWFDTFDWRLHKKGLVLELDQHGRVGVLRLHGRDIRASLHQQPVDTMPTFPAELPASRLRKQLMKICCMRALLPVTSCLYASRSFDVRDSNGKTTARLLMASFHTHRGNDDEPLHEQCYIEPLRGYEDMAETLRRHIEPHLDLLAQQLDPYDSLCRQQEIQPGLYASKLKLSLSPELRTDRAFGRLWLYLLGVMEMNEAGMREDIDTEFLHDYRVACRRSRTLLKPGGVLFTDEQAKYFGDMFAWLSQITGPCRDLDVFLLELDDLVAQSGIPAADATLADLRQVLIDERSKAWRKLVRALDSQRYARYKQDWQAWLQTAAAGAGKTDVAAKPIKPLADQRIWRVYKKIGKHGKRIDPQVDTIALHDLRKRCKKLRYLLEAFQSLYPSGDMNHLIKRLKKLQNVMGAIVDTTVQSEMLQHIRNDLHTRLQHDDSLQLVQQLIDHCDTRHERCLTEYSSAFATFASKEDDRLAKRLFKATDEYDEDTGNL